MLCNPLLHILTSYKWHRIPGCRGLTRHIHSSCRICPHCMYRRHTQMCHCRYTWGCYAPVNNYNTKCVILHIFLSYIIFKTYTVSMTSNVTHIHYEHNHYIIYITMSYCETMLHLTFSTKLLTSYKLQLPYCNCLQYYNQDNILTWKIIFLQCKQLISH